jgi:hypothetical protein
MAFEWNWQALVAFHYGYWWEIEKAPVPTAISKTATGVLKG